MHNYKHHTDRYPERNLGDSLIEWMRRVNEKKPDRHNESFSSSGKYGSDDTDITYLYPIKIKGNDGLRHRKTSRFRE